MSLLVTTNMVLHLYYSHQDSNVDVRWGAAVTTTKLNCAETAKTSAKAKISTKSDQGPESGCLPDCSQNVVDSFSHRRQSVCQVF